MKELILGIDARCSHGLANPIGNVCAICEWEAILAKKPVPFQVKFIGQKILEHGAIYTVVGVIIDGSMVGKGPIPGLLLRSLKGDAVAETFDPILFTLVKDEKNSD